MIRIFFAIALLLGGSAHAQTWQSLTSTSNLHSYWNGDANNDSTADPNDVKAHYNMEWSGSATYGTAPTGKGPGRAFQVSSGNNLVTGVNLYTQLNSTAAFSIVGWVNATALDASAHFYSFRNANAHRMSLGLNSTPTSQLLGVVANTSSALRTTPTSSISTGSWKLCSLVFDGSLTDADKVKIYDGNTRIDNAGATISFTTTTASTSSFRIGSRSTATDFPFNGLIYGVRVYPTVALTTGELAQIVAGPEPTNTVAPAISVQGGGPAYSQISTLTVADGTWNDYSNGTGTTTRVWYVNGVATGQTGTTFDTGSYFAGDQVTCIERRTNDGGYDATADTTSNSITLVEQATGKASRYYYQNSALDRSRHCQPEWVLSP